MFHYLQQFALQSPKQILPPVILHINLQIVSFIILIFIYCESLRALADGAPLLPGFRIRSGVLPDANGWAMP